MAELDSGPPKWFSYIFHYKHKMLQELKIGIPWVGMLSRLIRHFVPGTPGVLRAPGVEAEITLRLANVGDEHAVERLAALYDRAVPEGPLLLAEVDGELLAALTLAGDRELMDPYLPTGALIELLALRVKHLAAQAFRQPATAARPRSLNGPRDRAARRGCSNSGAEASGASLGPREDSPERRSPLMEPRRTARSCLAGDDPSQAVYYPEADRSLLERRP